MVEGRLLHCPLLGFTYVWRRRHYGLLWLGYHSRQHHQAHCRLLCWSQRFSDGSWIFRPLGPVSYGMVSHLERSWLGVLEVD